MAKKALVIYYSYGILIVYVCRIANETDFIASGARIAAEIGADIIKAFYCKDFEKVTCNCPVPVILAGGPKDADITAVVREVVSKGAKGLAFGRNLFQAEDIKGLVRDLDAALRG